MARRVLIIAVAVFALVWLYFEMLNRQAAPTSNVRVVPATDISIHPVEGKSDLRLSDLKGKVVLVDFWATWCGPCRMSMPAIEAIYKKLHARGFEVMGVALENDDGSHVPFVAKEIGVTYPVGLPLSHDEVSSYSTGSIPLMVLVDKKGMIRWAQNGYAPEMDAEIERQVDGLLKE